jgi:hypothetical protein
VVIGRLNRSLPPAVLRQLIDDGCIDKQCLDGARGAPICESYFVSTISKIGINRPSEVRRREQATGARGKKAPLNQWSGAWRAKNLTTIL